MSKVTIRKKAISKGRQTLYLDYYPPIMNPETGKPQRREYLKLYLYDKPLTNIERLHNKETNLLVEFIRAKRQLEIQNRRFGFLSTHAKEGSFTNYYKSYVIKHQKSESDNYAMSFRYFEAFAGDDVKFNELNDYLLEDYKSFLLGGPGISRTEKPIVRNTAVNYFSKLRVVLKEVHKKGLIDTDLYQSVKPIYAKEVNRERL